MGDDDGDNCPNQEEIRWGSDPKDPASQCYSAKLSEAGKAVGRGSEVTFTVILNRHFNFEGEVKFITPNSVPGVLWTFGRLSATLGAQNSRVSLPFTLQTTSSTPIGRHRITMHITSGGMKTEQTFILVVLPEGENAGFPTERFNSDSPS